MDSLTIKINIIHLVVIKFLKEVKLILTLNMKNDNTTAELRL